MKRKSLGGQQLSLFGPEALEVGQWVLVAEVPQSLAEELDPGTEGEVIEILADSIQVDCRFGVFWLPKCCVTELD
jgi:hypothetical protein